MELGAALVPPHVTRIPGMRGSGSGARKLSLGVSDGVMGAANFVGSEVRSAVQPEGLGMFAHGVFHQDTLQHLARWEEVRLIGLI